MVRYPKTTKAIKKVNPRIKRDFSDNFFVISNKKLLQFVIQY